MSFVAKDENEFSKKNKVTLERYDKLRSDYDNVILNFNGINRIIDNPTAYGYPYQNKKQASTAIAKKYRDRKYFSVKNPSQIDKEFTASGTHEFDVTQGYYNIKLISGGAGGLVLYGNHSNRCAEVSGTSGSYYNLDLYFPSNGHMKVVIGKGGSRIIRSDYNIGKWDRQVATVAGGNTYVYFNDILIAECRGGGNVQYVFRSHDHDGDIEEVDIHSENNTLGNYIIKVNNFIDNKIGKFGEKGNKTLMDWNYVSNNYPNNGVGGRAWAKDNNIDEIKNETKNGKDGYFKIISISPNDYDYLIEGIDVESRLMHTISNENEIRRKFNKALKDIYNRLSSTTFLVKDACLELGEVTDESTTALHYSDDNMRNYPYKLIDVKTTKNSGCLSKDEYIIVWDKDFTSVPNEPKYIKRKLSLSDWTNYNSNTNNGDVYQPYIYGTDIIYIKKLEVNTIVYKYNDKGELKEVGTATYNETPKVLKLSTTTPNTYSYSTSGATLYVTLVGAGGGAGGGSWADRWKTHGGAGGSGSYFKGTFHVNGNFSIIVGAGGTGGAGQRKAGSPGNTGGDTIFKIGNVISVTAGAGGGGQGSKKKNNYPPYPQNGLKGMVTINSYDGLMDIEVQKDGNGGNVTEAKWSSDIEGMLSVYPGTDYGAGGGAPIKANGENGKNGYAKLELKEDRKLIYQGNEYKPYDGIDPHANVILWSHYQYDLQKLNRLKEYVATKDSWFDGDGYCQRSCQINCQTSVQKS